MAAIEDIVRFFQLPQNAPGVAYVPQSGQTTQEPVLLTIGQGSQSKGLRMFTTTYSITIALYCDQAAVEQREAS